MGHRSRVAAGVRPGLDSQKRTSAINQDERKDLPAFIIVSPNAIAARAYEIYLARGASDGFDREDWVRAERELKACLPRDLGGAAVCG
jgi:Protein of unknown function (DUF2934)